MSVLQQEVRSPAPSAQKQIALAAHPSTGGASMHMVGQAGPLPPFVWSISAAGSLNPPAWTAATPITRGTVVLLPAGTYTDGGSLSQAYALCTTAGTTGSAAPTQLGTGIADGNNGLLWTIVGFFANGLFVFANTGTPTIGPRGGEILPVPANLGLTLNSFALPSSIFVASGGAFQVIVWGAP